MMKIKKILISVLIVITAVCLGCFVGCQNNQPPLTPPPVEQTSAKITLDKTKLQLTRGESYQMQYTLDEEDEEIEGTPTWYSFNENVAIVDASGRITAISEGTTVIVASMGEYNASCDILVSAPTIDVEEIYLSLSGTTITLNAQSQYNSLNLTATLICDGQKVEAPITWTSTNTENVSVVATADDTIATISALTNSVTETITATATYNGTTVSASCVVVCQGFYVVIFDKDQIVLYPEETADVSFDLYVDGEQSEAEKVNATYAVSDSSVIEINNDGRITAIKQGQAQAIVSYGGKDFTLNVTVGENVYVNNARQFMEIDGNTALAKYILQNDIDLSEYFVSNPPVNAQFLINNLYGIVDGNGYTVSGWHRLSTSADKGFNGIFNSIEVGAKIFNLGVKAVVDTEVSTAIVGNRVLGDIENCVFDVQVNSTEKVDKVLFNINNGNTKNSVFIVADSGIGSAQTGVAYSGIAQYDSISVISEDLTFGAENGANVNDNFTNSYYYASASAFENKTAKILTGAGASEDANFIGDNFDKSVFTISDGEVYLINDDQSKPYEYVAVESFSYDSANVGEQITILLPTAEQDQQVSYAVLDYSYSDVTKETCLDGKFTPLYTGKYYVITYVKADGLYSSSLSAIEVQRVVPKINATSIVLGEDTNEFQLQIEGKSASDYNFVSSDSRIATVSADGKITAVKAGTIKITVAEKQGSTAYNVFVTIVNSKTEVNDYAGLVEALTNANEGDYIVLTSDIEINSLPIHVKNDVNYAFIIDDFKGILDGQGHLIKITYNSTSADDVMCGLFNHIAEKAEVKNLYYDFTATYVPTGKVSYTSTFARSVQGTVSSCYLKSTLYPNKYSNQEGIIGYLENTNAGAPTAYIYDSIFDFKMIVDGKIQNTGYAVKWGLRNPYGYDCALIRNSANNEFYATIPNGSVLEGSGCTKYNTLYDFVNGINGYFKSQYGVVSKVSEGHAVYSVWGPEWEVDFDQIKLCGRKITDVAFEEYNVSKGIEITDTRGTLSWGKEIGTVNIYINDQLMLTQNDNSINVIDYIRKNYEEYVGEFKIVIDNGTISGAVNYKIIELTNANFVSELRNSRTADQAKFKYFLFGEDITLNGWNGNDKGDFTKLGYNSGEKDKTDPTKDRLDVSGYYVFDTLHGNIDALGHTLTVNIDTTATNVGGLIGNNRAFFMNMKYVVKAKHGSQINFMAGISWNGGFENCYIQITSVKVDAQGNVIVDNGSSFVGSPRKAIYKNLIVVLNGTEGSTLFFSSEDTVYPTFENIVLIRDTQTSKMLKTNGVQRQIINCYHYTSLSDFVNGGAGKLLDIKNDEPDVYTEISGTKAIEMFGSEWTINDKEVKLLGKLMVKVSKTGDNFVNDENIVG